MTQPSLREIYAKYAGVDCHSGSDKGSVHSYIDVYETLLAPYRACLRTLEIGIMTGHSLRMWEEYFHVAGARPWTGERGVHGVDLCDRPHGGIADLRPMIAEGTHRINLLDATDEWKVFDHFGGCTFDVIIEDAGHSLEQQLLLYSVWKKYLAPDGLYVIEDVDRLDEVRGSFERIGGKIIDLRGVKGRFDDVLVVFGGGR